jgi:hypothetical protein
MTRNAERLSLARDVLYRLERYYEGEQYGDRLNIDQRYLLLDLVKAEIFKRERIEQQKADGKRVRREIRARIGP